MRSCKQAMQCASAIHVITLSLSVVLICLSTASNAMDTRVKTQLLQLDPLTRLEQRCNLEAMEHITRDNPNFDVDKVLAYAFSDPLTLNRGIKAKGAAMRSKGSWYKLSYKCNTKDNYMTITSFKYKIGRFIHQNEWAKHYLVP